MFRKNPAALAKRNGSDGIDNLIDGLNPPQPTNSDDIASTSDDEEEISSLFEGYGSEKSDDEDEDWPEEGNDAAWEEGVELVGPNSNSQTVVERAIDKTRNMVKLLRKSALARDTAENIRARMESPPPMPLALDVRTRWNSCLHMIKEVLKNQATYERLHSEVRRITDKHSPVRKIITQCDLSAMDYETLTSLALCLEPFNEVTSYLGVTKFSTLPTLLISIMLVKSFLVQLENSNELQRQHRFCAKLLPALKQKLGKYFSYTTENDWVVCACYLNPDSRNMSEASEAVAPEYTITDARGRSAVFACLQSLGLLDDESGGNTLAATSDGIERLDIGESSMSGI
ncbi:hypothetical protein FOL47_004561 [Perkinsus chesapeaki]|uniref:Uncharacterized protein n=1 Tax=Perkinsus chesapeaki TaxID=330153 RepID=A0A7J6MYZ8_PERCH|nr:hypothetical protein FOL47_004561 [Perkinsus chesapeaki]